MKWKHKESWHRLRQDHEYLPPWWWGIGYRCYDIGYSVYYPMPLNWIVQVAVLVKWRWDRFRCRASIVDAIVERRVAKRLAGREGASDG